MRLAMRFKKQIHSEKANTLHFEKADIPDGLVRKCRKCKSPVFVEEVRNNFEICPKCNGYFRVHGYRRIAMIADAGSFEEWDKEYVGTNPLSEPEYEEKVKALQKRTGLKEAVITGRIRIDGKEVAVGVMDNRFLMASMGEAVGEKITRLVERAMSEKLPIVLFCASGGARMQEGMFSLMQMAKTAAAIKRFQMQGGFYLSILTDPTMGGVTASFAMLGDVILAEPNALIGFAGPRVIEQTIGCKLPKGFQRSEFLLKHGLIDGIVAREELKETVSKLLTLHTEKKIEKTNSRLVQDEMDLKKQLDPWEVVQASRKLERPVTADYITGLFESFYELHGDREEADDAAILGGIALFQGCPVTVIGQEKGHTTQENMACNFAMSSPAGYRKALRLMKQAERFHRPIITFVDTPGAFCGIEAEENGQGQAIATNLSEMSCLKVPILSIVIGEGGSGGALALALADQVWMLEKSIYSILSPEGYASILWKDSKLASKAARKMKLTSYDLLKAHMIEKVIMEPDTLNTQTMQSVIQRLDGLIEQFLQEYSSMDTQALLELRYQRYRTI